MDKQKNNELLERSKTYNITLFKRQSNNNTTLFKKLLVKPYNYELVTSNCNHREFRQLVVRSSRRGERRRTYTGSVDEAKQRLIKRSSLILASGATRPFSRQPSISLLTLERIANGDPRPILKQIDANRQRNDDGLFEF